MTQKTAIQVYVGAEDYGCPVRFDHLFADSEVANRCVQMLEQLYPPEDILVREVPVHSDVPRFYLYRASVPFAAPTEVVTTAVSPTLHSRPFQHMFEQKSRHVDWVAGWGATEEEAVAAAYSLYELASVRGIVEAYREGVRGSALREEQIWARARTLGKVTRNRYTREEEIEPATYATLYDVLTQELSLD